MKHVPLAIYSAEANKTFFVYGGTSASDQRRLLITASGFDHATGTVPRPTLVFNKTAGLSSFSPKRFYRIDLSKPD